MSKSESVFPPFGCPPFATYIPARTPAWKAHMSIGQARSALSYGDGGARNPETDRYEMFARVGELWKYDGSWQRMLVVEPRTFVSELPWKKRS